MGELFPPGEDREIIEGKWLPLGIQYPDIVKGKFYF
jgi:hypothetical protein